MIPPSAAWLATQRWFRAKQRPIASVTEVDHATFERAELRVLEVAYTDGGASDRYLLPTVGAHEPSDGDGAWASIVRAMADGAELKGARGRFVCSPTDVLDELLPSAHEAAAVLDERKLVVEQSNTSVVIGGDRLILKLYRLLDPGENPDLEVSAFLTEVGFGDTPAVAGAMTYRDEAGDAAAAMLQAFVPSRGDAWAAMLRALGDDPAEGVRLAGVIGGLTAAMHEALASRPDHPAFPARAATIEETAGWRASAEGQLAQAVTSVGGDAHRRLVALAPAVSARFADTFGSATGEARVSRIHGDYHLGQLLARTDGGFSVIDFEGEPARPLEERRRPGSPLRDVAGLLRSLDYAARTAERRTGLDAEEWLAGAGAAFIGAYGTLDPSELALLGAFELEKACYEVRYEVSNRPDWLWLPLAAVDRLVSRRHAIL